jgi:predicted RNA binding protein YcfA (HicA-like mRNA interferase family)
VEGAFNSTRPPGFDGTTQDVAFGVGGFDRVLPGSRWKRVGRGDRYVYKHDGDRGKVDYFIGGSSKSKLQLRSKEASLGSAFPDRDNVPVGVSLGGVAATVDIAVDQKGNNYKYGSNHPAPEFFVDTVGVSLNRKSMDRDALVFSGRVAGPFSFDPFLHDLDLNIGPFALTIPAGGWSKVKGSKLTYKHKDPSGLTVLVKANFEEGTLSMKVNKADLHLLFGNETLQVHLNLEGIPGADWTYQIVMKSTGEGSKLRY